MSKRERLNVLRRRWGKTAQDGLFLSQVLPQSWVLDELIDAPLTVHVCERAS